MVRVLSVRHHRSGSDSDGRNTVSKETSAKECGNQCNEARTFGTHRTHCFVEKPEELLQSLVSVE